MKSRFPFLALVLLLLTTTNVYPLELLLGYLNSTAHYNLEYC